MKPIRNYLLGINIAVLMIIAFGCKEYTTKTRINDDGSCERIVSVEGDISKIAELPFPVPTGNGWKIVTKKSEKDSTKNIYTAIKNFSDVKQLADEYTDSTKIPVQIKFEKKFRWFYTYYEYEETYKSYFPVKSVPLEKYLSKEDYQKFLDGDTTKALEQKLVEYADKSYKEYFLSEFLKLCERKNIKEVTQAAIDANKNKLLLMLEEKEGSVDEVINSLGQNLGTKSLISLRADIEQIVGDIAKRIEWAGAADGTYTNQISMPGVILETNSKSVKGNVVEWKASADRFQFADLVMKVTSRSANMGVFILSGIVVILALLLLLIPKFRRTTKSN